MPDSLAISYLVLSSLSLGATVLALALVLRAARKKRQQSPTPAAAPLRVSPWTSRAARIASGVLAATFLALIGAAHVQVQERRDQFHELASTATSLSFQREGKRYEVSDPKEVASFFALVEGGARMGAHHSHPTREVEVLIGTVTYAIGRDSKQHDELWVRQLLPRPSFGDPTLFQLRSKDLSDWMAKIEAQL